MCLHMHTTLTWSYSNYRGDTHTHTNKQAHTNSNISISRYLSSSLLRPFWSTSSNRTKRKRGEIRGKREELFSIWGRRGGGKRWKEWRMARKKYILYWRGRQGWIRKQGVESWMWWRWRDRVHGVLLPFNGLSLSQRWCYTRLGVLSSLKTYLR